jgi:tryptophan-rich sensory protein
LWVAEAACRIQLFSINKVAGMLFNPYQAWVTFATVITIDILKNGDKQKSVKE